MIQQQMMKRQSKIEKILSPDEIVELDAIKGFKENSKRRSGNSTRQVDYAIQQIFSAPRTKVLVIDHAGTISEDANKRLFKRVVDRLIMEHNLDYALDEGIAEIDYKKQLIRWGTIV